jgi:uncharacterized protein YciI
MALHAVIYRYSTDSAALDEHRPEHKDYLCSLFEQGDASLSAGRSPRAAVPVPC